MTDEQMELMEEVLRLRGTIEYIWEQAKLRPSGDSLTLSVIERNASAALNIEFQRALKEIRAAQRARSALEEKE